jgi:cell division septation protein DedD
MTDQSFHEIQLSRKQLVFLFMAAVIVAVSVFLLGVSFGRSVRPATVDAAAGTPPGDAASTAVVPPQTEVKPTDLTYHDTLQGRGQPAGDAAGRAAEPAPPAASQPSAPPAPTPQSSPSVPPPATPAAATSGAAKPVAPPPSQPAAPRADPPPAAVLPATSTSGTWLQTGAFSTMDAAQGALAKLKNQRYPASIRTEAPGAAARFKVVVGPYASSADLQRVKAQLQKDGYSPLPKR